MAQIQDSLQISNELEKKLARVHDSGDDVHLTKMEAHDLLESSLDESSFEYQTFVIRDIGELSDGPVIVSGDGVITVPTGETKEFQFQLIATEQDTAYKYDEISVEIVVK